MIFLKKAKGFLLSVVVAALYLSAGVDVSGQTIPDDGKRYAMMVVYSPDGRDDSQSARTARLSFDKGCNAIEIGISWDRVFPKPDSPGNWSDIDYFVNLALQRGAKVALRINTCKRYKDGFWPDEQSMRDTRGAAMNVDGLTHFRFGYEPALAKTQDFIRAITQRYQYLQQQGNLLFMSVTFNPQWENEYWGQNYPVDGGYPYQTFYDFGDLTIADFQRWLLVKYKGGLSDINRAWNSNYKSVTDIRPPIPTRPEALFPANTAGTDWFLFRHGQFKNYVDKTTLAIKGVNPAVRVINQHGAVSDLIAGNRSTLAFKNLAELTDGIKVNDGPDALSAQLSMDLLRSNVKPGDWIMAEVDGASFQSVNPSDIFGQMRAEFKYGAKALIFANFFVDFNEPLFRQTLDKMNELRLLSEPVSVIAPVGTVTYKLSDIVRSNIYEIGTFGAWNAMRGSDGKPVRLVIDEDLLRTVSGSNQPPVVQNRVPNQMAFVGKPFMFTIPDNTFADADGRIASVGVNGLPIGFSYDANSRQISGTGSLIGSAELTVTATDDKGATVSDYFSLIVQRATSPLRLLDPILDCGTGKFELRITDGDGSAVEFKAENVFDWTSQAVQTLPADKRVNTALVLKARQSGAEISLNYTSTCPANNNQPPVVSNSLVNQTGVVSKVFSYIIPENTFSDPDGKIVSIAVNNLPSGLNYDPTSRLITGYPPLTGTTTVTVIATDDKGATVSTTFTVTISSDVKPLKLITPSLDCSTQKLDVKTADGDGSAIEFKLDNGNWSSEHLYTLNADDVSGKIITILARQGGKETSPLSYTTDCTAANKPPVVSNAIVNQVVNQGKTASFTIPENTFSDPDGKVATITVSGLPTGLNYDPTNRLIAGTPSVLGTWTVTATATDDKGATVSTKFTVTVVKPLTMQTPTLECETGRLTMRAVDGDGSLIEYRLEGVTNWSKTAELVLPADRRYGGVLQVRARQSGTELTLNYTNTCVRPNRAPIVANPIVDQAITVSQATTVAIPASTFSDPDGDALTVSVTGAPVGLTYDPVRRLLRGTPALIGSSRVIAKATDPSAAAVSDTFRITVRAAPRFSATASLLDDKGTLIKELVDGALLDIRKLPSLINLSCVPKSTSGSVLMELTGKARRTVYANSAPYKLYPTGQGLKPDIGSYQLAISVYTGPNGTGNLLGSTVIHFDIVQVNEPGSISDNQTN
ncbi:putative Ig domain-containing protein [Fibrella sp. HMF5335]|uniref:Ig domain-containing protein n=1 Tax=Fibrella rubiginis TaxID=2817060 RepID=A0A939GI49_9BACT|nr:putative Ig domain-containing protein [Fibrella rubiginis]MBO0938233.1 putative Ig domain-containing protein [Fibrella rubiginis]